MKIKDYYIKTKNVIPLRQYTILQLREKYRRFRSKKSKD